MYFKTVPGCVNSQFTSLPKVMKKIKSTPQKNFIKKNVVFLRLYHVSKTAMTIWGLHISKPFPQTKTKIGRLVYELNPEL